MHLANTFFTALAFVSWVADTGAHDARAMVIAGDINALVRWDITLCSLPATVAQAPSFHVLPISTAQHRAGRYGQTTKITLKQMENHFKKEHKSLAYDLHSLYTLYTALYIEQAAVCFAKTKYFIWMISSLLTVFSYECLKQTNKQTVPLN